MSQTKILECKAKCKHDYQDKLYGKGQRVFNEMMAKKGEGHLFRCTVCKATRTVVE
jgi:hypothetical protein